MIEANIDQVANLVFLSGSALKAVLLFPTLRDKNAKVPRTTSVTTMCCWFAFATVYLFLGMPPAAIATYLGAVMWLLVAVYRNGEWSSAERTPNSVTEDGRM